jgi:hypothetical protein
MHDALCPELATKAQATRAEGYDMGSLDAAEIDLDICSYLYLGNIWKGSIIVGGNCNFPHHTCDNLDTCLAGNKWLSDQD